MKFELIKNQFRNLSIRHKKNRRGVFITAIYLLLILIVSYGLFYFGYNQNMLHSEQTPRMKNGVLDLRNHNFNNIPIIKLQGDAEFYWNKLHYPSAFFDESRVPVDALVKIPGVWNGTLVQGTPISGKGFGTYRFKILLNYNTQFGLKIREFDCAYKLFVNGKELATVGQVGTSKETSVPDWRRKEVYFISENREIEVVIQISNFEHRKGGAEDPIIFGLQTDVMKHKAEKMGIAYFLLSVMLIMFIYHLIMFIYRPKDKSIIFFSLLNLVFLLRHITVGEKLWMEFFPNSSWLPMVWVEYLSYMWALPLFMLFVQALYPDLVNKRWVKRSVWVTVTFSVFVIFAPSEWFTYTPLVFQLFIVAAGIYILYVFIIALIRRLENSFVLLGSYFFFFFVVVNDVLYYNKLLDTSFNMTMGIFIIILSHAFVISKNNSKAFAQVESLSIKLDANNRELEKTVVERTDKITKQKEEIEKQKAELEQQALLLKEVNGQLMEMDKFKEGMIGMIVHDLKNPLNVILNASKNELVLLAGNQMLNLVQNLLDVQKYQQTTMQLNLASYPINEITNRAIENVNILLRQRNISLQNGLNQYIFFKFDNHILERVIINLLTNAIKYSPIGSSIILSYEISEGVFTMKIKDFGDGIPDEKKDIIFSRYGQVLARKLGQPESTGLGLAFCKMAIEAHNGQIGFESEYKKGSTFWFAIPCLDLVVPDQHVFSVSPQTELDYEIMQLDKVMSHNDYDYLKPFVVNLSKYRIYELTLLKQALMAVSTNYSAGVFIWTHKMQNAIESMHEELFSRMIASVLLR